MNEELRHLEILGPDGWVEATTVTAEGEPIARVVVCLGDPSRVILVACSIQPEPLTPPEA